MGQDVFQELGEFDCEAIQRPGFPPQAQEAASATPDVADFKDVDIDEWVLELSVMTSTRLPFPAVPRKI